MRSVLTPVEVELFIQKYLENPKDLPAAVRECSDLFKDSDIKTLHKYGLTILQNKEVRQVITEQFREILKDMGVDDPRKKFAETLIKADKLAVNKDDARTMLEIAKLWGELAGEIGLKQIKEITGEVQEKLSAEKIKELEDGRVESRTRKATYREETG